MPSIIQGKSQLASGVAPVKKSGEKERSSGGGSGDANGNNKNKVVPAAVAAPDPGEKAESEEMESASEEAGSGSDYEEMEREPFYVSPRLKERMEYTLNEISHTGVGAYLEDLGDDDIGDVAEMLECIAGQVKCREVDPCEISDSEKRAYEVLREVFDGFKYDLLFTGYATLEAEAQIKLAHCGDRDSDIDGFVDAVLNGDTIEFDPDDFIPEFDSDIDPEEMPYEEFRRALYNYNLGAGETIVEKRVTASRKIQTPCGVCDTEFGEVELDEDEQECYYVRKPHDGMIWCESCMRKLVVTGSLSSDAEEEEEDTDEDAQVESVPDFTVSPRLRYKMQYLAGDRADLIRFNGHNLFFDLPDSDTEEIVSCLVSIMEALRSRDPTCGSPLTPIMRMVLEYIVESTQGSESDGHFTIGGNDENEGVTRDLLKLPSMGERDSDVAGFVRAVLDPKAKIKFEFTDRFRFGFHGLERDSDEDSDEMFDEEEEEEEDDELANLNW